MKLFKFIIVLLITTLASCQSLKNICNPPNDAVLYQNSIEESMSPAPSKIYSDLVSITPLNKNLITKTINGENHILVVTWKQNVSYYKPYLDSAYYNTGSYPIWITTAPELLGRIKKEKTKDVNLRLKQLLGLPPNSVYNYFVEFWVKPEDLFRPCPDNEITDNTCELCFPENTTETFKSWINSNRISRYYPCELYDKYPWTQLGYTYDWNPKNKSHVGLSEFVIGENKHIVVEAIYTTDEYLSKDINKTKP